ncbi:hypothetical protein Ahy_A10g047905 [Arachis hypogaea]|uniref:Transposase MuDR plant domain-containing protein n=1 Tax=Arachis hypogaea TaxID=3818 RepID=A0A445B3T9_ARAHY|nr:hypothetical protein Ahy_A10g047905 [Arachis hypogaea]
MSKFSGTTVREIGRVGYRLLAPMGNGVFRFRLFRLQGKKHIRLMFDIHGRIMEEHVVELSAEWMRREGKEESDEDYVTDSVNSDSFEGGDEDEIVSETPAQTMARHVLPPPHPIPALSVVPSHYHSLVLDAMYERTPFSDTSEKDYNLDGRVEFRVSHRFKSRETVLQGVKNYTIRRRVEYRVIESDRLKYHVQFHQADNGCQWSLRMALRQNLGYLEVWRVGRVHSCLAPTMS